MARSAQTCALGAALAGAVAAGVDKGGFKDFESGQSRICGNKPTTFKPDSENHIIYNELYRLYRELHDAFGTTQWRGSLFHVMKDLMALAEKQRKDR